MRLVHHVERGGIQIGSCVEDLASGDQVYVAFDEAEKMTDTTQDEWDNAEAIDVRNLAIRNDNSSPRFRDLAKESA